MTTTANGLDLGGDAITNIAAGTTDTSAVNKKQMEDAVKAASGTADAAVDNLGEKVAAALGGSAAYDKTTNTWTAPSYEITKTDGSKYTAANNIGTALGNLNAEVIKPITFVGDTGTTANTLGSSFSILAGNNADTSTANLATKVEAGKVTISMANAPTFTGTVTAPTFSTGANGPSMSKDGINAGGKTISNVGDGTAATDVATKGQMDEAVKALGDSGIGINANTGGLQTHKLGKELAIVAATKDTTASYTSNNLTTEVVQDATTGKTTVSISMKESPEFKSLVLKDGANSTTLTTTANGLDLGGDKLTNLGAGSTVAGSTDAITGGQLNTALGSVATNLGGGSTYDPATGKLTAPSYSIGGTAYNNVGAALTALDGITNKPITFVGDARVNGNTTDITRKLGETLTIKGGADAGKLSENNIGVVTDIDTNTMLLKLAKELSGLTSVRTGDATNGTLMDAKGITITKTPTTGTAGKTVSLTGDGLNNGGNQIVGVASGLPTDGTVTDASGTTLTNAANIGDVKKALGEVTDKGMSFAGDSGGTVTRKLGETLTIVGGVTDSTKLSENNIGVVTDPDNGKMTVKLAKEITLDKVTTVDASGNSTVTTATGITVSDKDGKNKTVTTATGTTITSATGSSKLSASGLSFADKDGKVGLTLDGATNKITNLADGTIATGSKDAINGGQLYDKMANIKTVLGEGITVGADGTLTGSNIGGTTSSTISGAIAEVGALAKKHTTVVAGSNVVVSEDTNASGGKEYTVAVAKDISLDSVTTGSTKMTTDGITISNADSTKNVSLTGSGLNNGGNKLTNVAGGSTATDSKDAINGGQLNTALGSVAANLGGGSKYDPETGKITAPTYAVTDENGAAKEVHTVGDAIDALGQGFKATSAQTGTGTVSGTSVAAVKAGNTVTYIAGDNISLTQDGMKFTIATNKEVSFDKVSVGKVTIDSTKGLDAGGTVVTGLGEGALTKGSTDAVTGGQLYITNEAIAQGKRDLIQLRNDSNAGDAMNAALSALKPLQYDPMEPTQIMAGVGHYEGHSAGAIGIAHYRNESNLYNIGISTGGANKFIFNAGATWKFGKSKNESQIPEQYRKGPLSSVYVMQKENTVLKGKVQDLENNNATLKQTTESQAKEIEILKKQMQMMMERMGM